jgi:hypothetical protein
MTQSQPAPITPADLLPAFVRVVTFTGGAFGDDVDQATANTTFAYSPRTQAEKASLMVPAGSLAVDVARPRGWIQDDQPYQAPPASPAGDPVISSLAPNTAVAVTGPDVLVTITGLRFTPWSTVRSGNYPIPSKYVDATHLTILQSPKASVAGVVQVVVTDHDVDSAPSNFTFT